jgi:hypothetical protein
MREHRTVVLPDYQGLGIGNRLSEFCAALWTGLGGRASSTTSHPAMIHYRSASPQWQRIRLGMLAPLSKTSLFLKGKRRTAGADSAGRITGSFRYIGPALPRQQAQQFVDARPAAFASPSPQLDAAPKV